MHCHSVLFFLTINAVSSVNNIDEVRKAKIQELESQLRQVDAELNNPPNRSPMGSMRSVKSSQDRDIISQYGPSKFDVALVNNGAPLHKTQKSVRGQMRKFVGGNERKWFTRRGKGIGMAAMVALIVSISVIVWGTLTKWKFINKNEVTSSAQLQDQLIRLSTMAFTMGSSTFDEKTTVFASPSQQTITTIEKGLNIFAVALSLFAMKNVVFPSVVVATSKTVSTLTNHLLLSTVFSVPANEKHPKNEEKLEEKTKLLLITFSGIAAALILLVAAVLFLIHWHRPQQQQQSVSTAPSINADVSPTDSRSQRQEDILLTQS
ncbi:unnamed protein product [Didymodactylos carnosus]|uniref:Transmembrane protein n=1 Tax=Didymodactylos carnosus TaxID=1234261 RepID=A0A8S2GZ48_9BILA|nr:unnamed protein product [Didymodactylos carnosus]CAF3581891.1 unnamed protein product [Didymodactylos carnosus]